MAYQVLNIVLIMDLQNLGPSRHRRRVGGFSLVEIMVAASILAVGLGSLVALNSQVINTLRRSTVASFASQLIQERMEQFRRASWTDITSDYPPDDPDSTAATYDADNTDPYAEYTYPTEFPYSQTELDALTPGMMELMAIPAASAAQLTDVVEKVKLETYNASNTDLTVFAADGLSMITIAPFDSGGTPIEVERRNGVVTKLSHNPVLVFSTTARLTLTITWTGTDNVQRTKETVTLFTVEGDK